MAIAFHQVGQTLARAGNTRLLTAAQDAVAKLLSRGCCRASAARARAARLRCQLDDRGGLLFAAGLPVGAVPGMPEPIASCAGAAVLAPLSAPGLRSACRRLGAAAAAAAAAAGPALSTGEQWLPCSRHCWRLSTAPQSAAVALAVAGHSHCKAHTYLTWQI